MADTQPDHPTISAQEALQRSSKAASAFFVEKLASPPFAKRHSPISPEDNIRTRPSSVAATRGFPPSSFSTPTLASSSSFASPAMSSLRKSWAACGTPDRICTHRYSSSWVIRDAALSLLHSIPRRMAPSISRVSRFGWMASSPDSPTQIPIFPPKRNLKKRWKRTFAGPSANCSLRRKERAP